MSSSVIDVGWWNILNSSIAGLIVGTIVSVVLYALNAASQKRLTKAQLQNDVFVRFGELGQEMWLLSGHAKVLHGRSAPAINEFIEARFKMLHRQGALRAIRLPLLLHFEDDDDERLAKRLKDMGDIFQGICDLLDKQQVNQQVYEQKQNAFHKCYAKLYADLALRIEKRRKPTEPEMERVAKIVMVK